MKTATLTAAAFAIALTASLVCAQEATSAVPELPAGSGSVSVPEKIETAPPKVKNTPAATVPKTVAAATNAPAKVKSPLPKKAVSPVATNAASAKPVSAQPKQVKPVAKPNTTAPKPIQPVATEASAPRPIQPVESGSVLILPPEAESAFDLEPSAREKILFVSNGGGYFDTYDGAEFAAPGKAEDGWSVNGEVQIRIPNTPLSIVLRGYYGNADIGEGSVTGYRSDMEATWSIYNGDFTQYGGSAELRWDFVKMDTFRAYVSAGGVYDKTKTDVKGGISTTSYRIRYIGYYPFILPYLSYDKSYQAFRGEPWCEEEGFGFIGHVGVEWIFLNDFYLNLELGGMTEIYDEEYVNGKAQADLRGVLGWYFSDWGRIDLYARYLTEWEALHAGAQVTVAF